MNGKVNILIEQGTTFELTVDMKDSDGEVFDTGGYAASGQIRKTYTSSTAVDLITTIDADSSLTLGLNAANTTAIEPGRYVYDVILTHTSGTVLRILEGICTISPDVTR